MEETINQHYKDWCKETKRNGAILIHGSIQEFIKYLAQKLEKPVEEAFIYEPTNQDILSKGTIIFNSETKEEDIIVNYKPNSISKTAKGRNFHVSANALGDGWKAVRKVKV